jgi:hypothetical protein
VGGFDKLDHGITWRGRFFIAATGDGEKQGQQQANKQSFHGSTFSS